MSREDFAATYSDEGDLCEFKQGISAGKLGEAVVAFSNTAGGTIAVGVAPDGRVVGADTSGEAHRKVHQIIAGLPGAGHYDFEAVSVEGRQVLLVHVRKRAEGFAQTPDGRVLVRRGASNAALIGPDLGSFISARAFRRFEDTDLGVSLAEASPDLLREVQGAWGWTEAINERLVEKGLAVFRNGGNTLTVAGALCLVDDPSKYLGRCLIQCFRYRDEGDLEDLRNEIRGPAQHQVREAALWLQQVLGKDIVISGVHRIELDRIPEQVLREAIANAVAHRSYEEQRRAIRIDVRPNRVIISSPGPLPEPVTVENLREQNSPRNLHLIDTMRRFRLAEDAGRGIDLIQDVMGQQLLEPPTFADDGTAVMVTLPLNRLVTSEELAWITELTDSGALVREDRILLVHAARGVLLSNKSARGILHVDSVQARASLQRLCQAGLLVQEGKRNGARYRLASNLPVLAPRRPMTEHERQALAVRLAAAGPVSNSDVRQATGLDRVEALRLLSALVEAGWLRREGERRGAKYWATESGKARFSADDA